MTPLAPPPPTLRELAGLRRTPAPLAASVLLIVDAQQEYSTGRLPLPGLDAAVRQIARLLARARAVGSPVIHVVQHGRRGSPICNPDGPFVDILDPLRPIAGESIVIKSLPSSFKVTNLVAEIDRTGRNDLVVVGFMSHLCVNSTVRDAAEAGYAVTVVAHACATRDLPDGAGGTLPAAAVHAANLAALRDRFAIIVADADDVP